MRSYLFIASICFPLLGCQDETPQPMDTTTNGPVVGIDPPADATQTIAGEFVSFAHNLNGKAVVYEVNSGMRTLRLETFTMSAGPDVFVFASRTNNYSNANVIELAKLTEGYSNTSISMEIDPGIDLATHPFILVYCVQYHSLFGYASLK